jgi:hypothetical protein
MNDQTNVLTIDRVEALFEHQDGWCISIYLPTHRSGHEIRENHIRLKNLVAAAAKQLSDASVEEPPVEALLKQVSSLCDMDAEENRNFWRHQLDGLAVFISANGTEFFRVAECFSELTVVAKRFHVRPLLKAAQQDGQFCVLAVSQNAVRFLEGSKGGLSSRPIEELPESLRTVVTDNHQKGFNLHSFRNRANSGENAVPHGHVDKNREHELTRYFREIDDALSHALKNDNRPLVFAGVDELFPPFKEQSGYSNLVSEHVAGNPDDSSADEIHARAWPLVSSLIEKQIEDDVSRWNEAAQTPNGGTCIKDIVIAAHDGRIDTLMLTDGQHCWGTFDAESRCVKIEDEPTAKNCDLLDLAAVRALRADGRVVIVPEGTLKGTDAAAIYRYVAAPQSA